MEAPDDGLLTTDFYSIDYANHGGVDRALLAAEGHTRGATLHDQDEFLDSGAYRIDRHDVTFLIFAIDAHKPRNQELAPV